MLWGCDDDNCIDIDIEKELRVALATVAFMCLGIRVLVTASFRSAKCSTDSGALSPQDVKARLGEKVKCREQLQNAIAQMDALPSAATDNGEIVGAHKCCGSQICQMVDKYIAMEVQRAMDSYSTHAKALERLVSNDPFKKSPERDRRRAHHERLSEHIVSRVRC